MNRLTKLFLIGLMLATSISYGQEHSTTTIVQELPRRLQVDDMYYPYSYRGVRLLMDNIQTENPDLHAKLSPAFKELKRKRNQARFWFISGSVVGTTLAVGSFTFLQKTETKESIFDPGSVFYESPKEEKDVNVGVLMSGVGCLILGTAIGYFISPDEADLYRVINLHNKYNSDEKIEWRVGFNYTENHEMGLKLTMNF